MARVFSGAATRIPNYRASAGKFLRLVYIAFARETRRSFPRGVARIRGIIDKGGCEGEGARARTIGSNSARGVYKARLLRERERISLSWLRGSFRALHLPDGERGGYQAARSRRALASGNRFQCVSESSSTYTSSLRSISPRRYYSRLTLNTRLSRGYSR